MIVPNVLKGLADLASLGKRTEAPDVKEAGGKAAAVEPLSPPTPTAAMREILSHYNLAEISPNDFSKLIQRLFDQGAISQKDFQELSVIRVDLENAGVDPDDSLNLLDFYRQKISIARDDANHSPDPAAAQPGIDLLVSRLRWLERFAAARQPDSPGGLDAMA